MCSRGFASTSVCRNSTALRWGLSGLSSSSESESSRRLLNGILCSCLIGGSPTGLSATDARDFVVSSITNISFHMSGCELSGSLFLRARRTQHCFSKCSLENRRPKTGPGIVGFWSFDMGRLVGVRFDPETVELLRSVLDAAWDGLSANRQRTVTKSELAQRILAAAGRGERDPDRLR